MITVLRANAEELDKTITEAMHELIKGKCIELTLGDELLYIGAKNTPVKGQFYYGVNDDWEATCDSIDWKPEDCALYMHSDQGLYRDCRQFKLNNESHPLRKVYIGDTWSN